MALSRKIGRHVRVNVVAYTALFFALSGGAAWATHPGGANTIDSRDIIDGQVKRSDLARKSVGISELDPAAFFAEDIRPSATGLFEVPENAIEGQEVASGTLGGSDVADESLTGADVRSDSLTGSDIDESTLRLKGCQDSLVRGFARIKGLSTMPSSYTTNSKYFVATHNCSGSAIEVRRGSRGFYYVRFVNSLATVGVASSDSVLGSNLSSPNDLENDGDNFVIVTWRSSPAADFGSFLVSVRDVDSGEPEDGAFNIIAY